MNSFNTIKFLDDHVEMINQLLLPHHEVYDKYFNYEDVAKAIKDMVIRGAPAIGIAVAYGIALAFINKQSDVENKKYFNTVKQVFSITRPTAVNLFVALLRMEKIFIKHSDQDIKKIASELLIEAYKIHDEDIKACKKIGETGAALLSDGSNILTYCNAGALATGGIGTALGVINVASQTKKIRVYACETRPYLQGARLTAWELMKSGVDVILITDNMACALISQGIIDAIVVGADRVAVNGDAANKIGTLNLAVVANHYKVPIYFALPTSTIDTKTLTGNDIEIEQRNPNEVTNIKTVPIAPKGVKVLNPAFDVTPASLISAIITEKGIFKRPYDFSNFNE